MLDRKKGFFLALGSSVLFGIVPIFGKISVNIFSPLFLAFVIPALVSCLLGFVAILKKDIVKNIAKKDNLWIVALGFFAAVGSLFSFHGLSFGKAFDAGFLLQFEILFASIFGYVFLKEKLSFQQIIGLLLMMLGAFTFTFETTFSFRIASILFLGAAFVWSINDVIVRRKLKTFSPVYLAFGRYFFSSIIIFPFSFSAFYNNVGKITIENVFFLLLYALVISGLILLLYNALKYVKIAEAISCQLLAPILTALISVLFLKERLEIERLLGGGVIIIGLFLMIQRKGKYRT